MKLRHNSVCGKSERAVCGLSLPEFLQDAKSSGDVLARFPQEKSKFPVASLLADGAGARRTGFRAPDLCCSVLSSGSFKYKVGGIFYRTHRTGWKIQRASRSGDELTSNRASPEPDRPPPERITGDGEASFPETLKLLADAIVWRRNPLLPAAALPNRLFY